jgi:hypothetical protein
MLKQWWIPTLILVAALMVTNVVAGRYRYKQLYKAYRFYSKTGISETFIDYTLMDGDELEETGVHPEIVSTRRRELFWSKLSTATYFLTMSICFSALIILFYGALTAPFYVGVAFTLLMILNAYLTRRAWRKMRLKTRWNE